MEAAGPLAVVLSGVADADGAGVVGRETGSWTDGVVVCELGAALVAPVC
jgi:hypothetical protein